MTEILKSRVELLAQEAESLDAFSGLNLLHIRREIKKILSLIGRGGFFDEYTRHDISHIDAMLAMVDWLVPEASWARMTPADALLQVLAIYFHDLGLLVTNEEYEARDHAVIERFSSELFDGDAGVDYRARIDALGAKSANRFIYQEFVRAHHGERIRAWVGGNSPSHIGAAKGAAAEVSALLSPLTEGFRADLGLVCESHHLDDLDRVDKYLTSRPYGSSLAETANVQYAAIILRTADLLHITSDRTPSVMYKLISPADPISQQEWAKQGAVESVRSRPGIDKEGNVDLTAERDTIEVFAEFTAENGFFGLTAYLAYARRQLHQTFEWAATSIKRHGSLLGFPWRYIDEDKIRTKGFLRNSFEFTLDQAKVLDLLTGHTLYNNTNVVLRELVQNSLDAIRLQGESSTEMSPNPGDVEVRWDTAQRRLTVKDNGTGMTQEVIERHLLTVGSSRYKDPEFRRQHPNFSSISRFGIGVLSTFMISDAVVITTCHPDEPEARRLSLRSVHGRYLIRLLDKGADPIAQDIGRHGTIVELHVRPSAKIGDVAEILESWIVVPRCKVTLIVDDGDPLDIGFENVGDSLASMIRGHDRDDKVDEPRRGQIRIVERSRDGVDLAFAVQWSDYFKEWTFVRGERFMEERRPVADYGMCVEGIRVARGTPGFRDIGVASVANATGLEAPKTDVARSGLENTPELRRTHAAIYQLLCEFVEEELKDLVAKRGFSLTWAAQEARWLLSPLVSAPANDRELLLDEAGKIPLLVVDDKDGRALTSPSKMAAETQFWTVHSEYFRSAEMLLRELPTTASVGTLSEALGISDFDPPAGPLLTTAPVRDATAARAFAGKEVAAIVIRRTQRRVDLGWEACAEPARWRRLGPRDWTNPEVREIMQAYRRLPDIYVAMQEININGREGETGVYTDGAYYVFNDTMIGRYLAGLIRETDESRTGEADAFYAYLVTRVVECLAQPNFAQDVGDFRDFLERGTVIGRARTHELITQFSSLSALERALLGESIELFSPDAWRRSTSADDEF